MGYQFKRGVQSRMCEIRARCDAYKTALDTYDDLKIIGARDNVEQEMWFDLLYLLGRIDILTDERDIWKRKFELCYAQMEEEASDFRCMIEELTRKLAEAKREG